MRQSLIKSPKAFCVPVVIFRSTWTPRGAVMFPHQCPWKTPWCHTSFLHSNALFLIHSVFICPSLMQKPDVPSPEMWQPLCPKLISPSCCFTAASVIRHLRSEPSTFHWERLLQFILVKQRRPYRMFLMTAAASLSMSKISNSVCFFRVYIALKKWNEYKLAVAYQKVCFIHRAVRLVGTCWDRQRAWI